ncbi:MAG TPA: acyl-ACP--UDP-N-acetylglucosamine O-acyltransferase [Gammaproteobacteria bacterium]|nr:acyl-ACP--UDP-N-acetylglucosamine O-acyltransferase [Gammaproteobacteria bacterium]
MIHDSAIVDSKAILAADVEIGPYSIIGDNVTIGSGTVIGPHVVIKGSTEIGENNQIYQFSSIGGDPQDKKYAGEPTQLIIGNNNVIRENCTISRGTAQGGGVTQIGNDNWIMAYVHIAHDCLVGDHTIFANAATLAGHVTIEDYAILGGFSNIHQFCRVGAHSFLAMSSIVAMDVPPFVMAAGHNAVPHGVNSEGLKRRGFSKEALLAIRNAYKIIYKSSMKLKDARDEILTLSKKHPELVILCEFLGSSERGIIR